MRLKFCGDTEGRKWEDTRQGFTKRVKGDNEGKLRVMARGFREEFAERGKNHGFDVSKEREELSVFSFKKNWE